MSEEFIKKHFVPKIREIHAEIEEELCYIEEHHPEINTERVLLNDLNGKIEGYFYEIGEDQDDE
jgi:hypothetical protein